MIRDLALGPGVLKCQKQFLFGHGCAAAYKTTAPERTTTQKAATKSLRGIEHTVKRPMPPAAHIGFQRLVRKRSAVSDKLRLPLRAGEGRGVRAFYARVRSARGHRRSGSGRGRARGNGGSARLGRMGQGARARWAGWGLEHAPRSPAERVDGPAAQRPLAELPARRTRHARQPLPPPPPSATSRRRGANNVYAAASGRGYLATCAAGGWWGVGGARRVGRGGWSAVGGAQWRGAAGGARQARPGGQGAAGGARWAALMVASSIGL
jgi:hypothetical protein